MYSNEFNIQEDEEFYEDSTGPPASTDSAPPPLKPLELGYPPTLPKDLAVAPNKQKEILEYYDLSVEQFELLTQSLNFRRDLSRWQQEVAKEGYTLKLKAGALAEEHLGHMVNMMTDPDTPSATSVKIYEILLGVGGVATKAAADVAASGTPQQAIQININLG